MSAKTVADLLYNVSYRTVCVLLIVPLIALPVHAAAGEPYSETACQQAPAFLGTFAASADSEFVQAAAVENLRPVGAAVSLLDDKSTVVTSVAARPYRADRAGVMFFRRDAVYALGSTLPGMLTDIRLGMDPARDVIWANVTLSLPGDSSLESASVEYAVEYRASELPEVEMFGAGESTTLLKEWATTAQPLAEHATVLRDGVEVAVEIGNGSFERAVESLVKASSRSRCQDGCRRHLRSGRFSVACLIAGVLGCAFACAYSYGTACVSCLSAVPLACRYLGSVVSLYHYLRCLLRC